jgi:purine-binding chemotaxis protein CheW
VPAPPAHIARLITPLRGMRRITPMRGTPAVAASRTLRERVRARTGSADLLLFRVAGERFAIDLAAVEEAIDLPPVHHVPEMPPAMLGVITVRGMLTPVYSPQAALGLALTDGASALIFKRGRHRFALVIDDVEDVMTLDLATLRDAPGVDESENVLLGVVRQRDALLALVDAESLLATCQAVPLLETA